MNRDLKPAAEDDIAAIISEGIWSGIFWVIWICAKAVWRRLTKRK